MADADNIKFDYAKANAMLSTFDECSRCLSELSSVLGNEIGIAGQWWKGTSFEEYDARFSGPGRVKSIIEFLVGRATARNSRLSEVSSAKKDLDRSLSSFFE
jgi:hypothetical protein